MYCFGRQILTVLIVLILAASVYSQDMRERYFSETDNLILQAKELQAPILSPNFFSEGMEKYKDAEEALKGNNLGKVQEYLREAKSYFQRSIDKAKISANTFIHTLKAREDAKAVDAMNNAKELWNDSEEKLNSAASAIEDNELKDARDYSFQAEKLYRSAELDAIKVIHLQEVWNLLKKADDEGVDGYAPKTLKSSKDLITSSERELENDRYNTAKADDLTAKSKYEANHAFFIMKKIEEINDKDLTMEDVLLEVEGPLAKVGNQLGVKVGFDKGLDAAADQLFTAVGTLPEIKKENEELKAKIAHYEERIGAIAEEQNILSARLQKIEQFNRKVTEIAALFKKYEAEVIKNNSQVTIRLKSLQFASGSSIIRPTFFDLLSRVQTAIRKFNNAVVTVEGHTDSKGKSNSNLALSQTRSDAVAKYLKANIGNESNKINAIGYGESRPIANNETESGRDKNRRIDIVIVPDID